MKTKTLLVLVDGINSRLQGQSNLEAMGPNGELLLDYLLFDASEAGYNKFVFVHDANYSHELKQHVFSQLDALADVEFVQKDPNDLPFIPLEGLEYLESWGNAQEIWRARHTIHEPFTVITSSHYYGKDAFSEALSFMENYPNDFGIVGFPLTNTLSDHGTVSRQVCIMEYETDAVSEIKDYHHISKITGGKIRCRSGHGTIKPLLSQQPVAMNIYCLNPFFFECLEAELTRFMLDYQYEEAVELGTLQVLEFCRKNGWKNLRLVETNTFCLSASSHSDKRKIKHLLSDFMNQGLYPEGFTHHPKLNRKYGPVYEFAS